MTFISSTIKIHRLLGCRVKEIGESFKSLGIYTAEIISSNWKMSKMVLKKGKVGTTLGK